MIRDGELVLCISPKGKRYLRRLDPKQPLHTHDGRLEAEAVRQAGFGGTALTHLGRPYLVLKPTLHDLCKNLKRQTQIIYPKDIGYILMRLSVGPGATVVEAGSGSGSMTLALAWFVGSTGTVHTFERREEFRKLCGRNLAWAGLDDGRVKQYDRDIAEGFDVTDADALFLDVRTPWEYLDQAVAAVKPGAPMAFLVPTVNQISDLLRGLEKGPFMDVEVLEILVRRYKPVPDRLRPADRMVAHTCFLIFCRAAVPPASGEECGCALLGEDGGAAADDIAPGDEIPLYDEKPRGQAPEDEPALEDGAPVQAPDGAADDAQQAEGPPERRLGADADGE